jgi:hypothetical protein
VRALRRVAGATALLVSLGVVAPVVAGAAPPTTVAHGHSSHDTPANALSAKAYAAAIKQISRSFANAITAATKKLKSALAAATTPGQRATARAKFRLAVAVASAARDAALVALGPPPAAKG